MSRIKVISGFQTGADRAGVHAAFALKQDGYPISTGGWVPNDRRANDGIISWAEIEGYGLKVHAGRGYPPRTEQNVKDSDGTVLFGDMTSPGCKLTIRLCKAHNKPYRTYSWDMLRKFTGNEVSAMLAQWIFEHQIEVLNVAGNREETNPGIYQVTFDIVTAALLEILQ